jgi:hypothetical protein
MQGIKHFAQAAVATTAMLVGGTASAAALAPDGLFFSGWDPINNNSILVNLGRTASTFFTDPNASFSLSGDGLAGLTSYLSTASSSFRWNVVAVLNDGSNDGTTASPFYGGLATSKNIETTPKSWGIFGGLEAFVGGATTFINTSNPNLASANFWVGAGQSALEFPGENNIGFSQFPGDLGAVGETLNFYRFFADQDEPFETGDFVKYGSFTLTGNSFGYTGPGGTGTEVPLPAAAWLLGSALLGLVGVGRRRRSAAEA